jgi:hypothetical protein
MNKEEILKKFDDQWNVKKPKMDWLGMENLLVDILKRSELSEHDKLLAVQECIDAFTRRGHFDQYLGQY